MAMDGAGLFEGAPTALTSTFQSFQQNSLRFMVLYRLEGSYSLRCHMV